MAVPRKDVELVPYSIHFDEKLEEGGTLVYKLPATRIADYSTARKLYTDSVGAVETARQNGVESKPLRQVRNAQRAAFLPVIRALYAMIQVNPDVGDAAKTEIGVLVPAGPTRRNPPKDVPLLAVKSSTNNVLAILAQSTGGSKRSLPPQVLGVTIFSSHAEVAPPTAAGWDWHGNFSRAQFEIGFDKGVTGKVWLCGVFYNDRGQGQASAPILVNLAGGNEVPNAERNLKLAA